jgi:hypothetical protein
MATIRRWYIYLVCLVTVQLVTWTAVALLRSLLAPPIRRDIETTAFQVAVLIIALPFFLAHWLWMEKRVERDVQERGATLRRLFLYGVAGSFIIPFAVNGYDLLQIVFPWLLGSSLPTRPGLIVSHSLVALAITAVFWFYFDRVRRRDEPAVAEAGNQPLIRHSYIYLGATVGLALTLAAVVTLLRWLLQSGASQAAAPMLSKLVTGLALWLISWQWGQRCYRHGDAVERAAIVRKIYLFGFLFIGVTLTVTPGLFILAGIFRRWLGLPPGGDIRDALPSLLVMAGLWAYQTYLLYRETELSAGDETPSAVRRLYHYLVAAVGLATLLGGLGGNLSVLIWAFGGFFTEMREAVAVSAAAMVIGLPVWLLPWRQRQANAAAPGAAGAAERQALTRKVYLYLYLFVATMAALASLVFIIARLLMALLGEPATDYLLTEIANALAVGALAAAVWLYHAFLLRRDQQTVPGPEAGEERPEAQVQPVPALRVALLDGDDGHLGCSLLQAFQRQLPELIVRPFGLTAAAAAAMAVPAAQPDISEVLAEADLIVGPWQVAVADGATAVTPEIAGAVVNSRAHKVLIPLAAAGWTWVGVNGLAAEAAVGQTVAAVKQITQVEPVAAERPLSIGSIVLIVIGSLIFLQIVLPILLEAIAF